MKPITSVAALESGTITPTTGIFDGGSFKEGTLTLQNAGGFSCGCTLTLPEALKISDDVFFYNVGNRLNTSNTQNGPMQRWMGALGLGQTTGIDVPGEFPGLVPTPAWRNQLYKEHKTDRPWSAGDSVNLAVGQGDLQADPLQMATAYAALANGGNVVRPHVGLEVDDPDGRVVQEINPAPQRHVNINPSYSHIILGALHEAAQSPGGTSYSVFGNYSIPVAGKTGTAQRVGQQDQSWYVVLAPYPNPQVAVAVTIEQGGFGVEAAAPAAQKILTAFFQAHGRKVKSGAIAPGTVPTGVSNY
jgi:penicillin-binding protein 2